MGKKVLENAGKYYISNSFIIEKSRRVKL